MASGPTVQLLAAKSQMQGSTGPNSLEGREESGRLSTVEALRVLEDPTDVKLKTLTQLARVAFGGSSLSGKPACGTSSPQTSRHRTFTQTLPI